MARDDDSSILELLDPEWAEARKRIAEERGPVAPSVPQPAMTQGQAYAPGSLPDEQPTEVRKAKPLLRGIGNVGQPRPQLGRLADAGLPVPIGAVVPVTSDLPAVEPLEQTDEMAAAPEEQTPEEQTPEEEAPSRPRGLEPLPAELSAPSANRTVGGQTAVITVPPELAGAGASSETPRVTDAGLARRLTAKGPGGTVRGLQVPSEALGALSKNAERDPDEGVGAKAKATPTPTPDEGVSVEDVEAPAPAVPDPAEPGDTEAPARAPGTIMGLPSPAQKNASAEAQSAPRAESAWAKEADQADMERLRDALPSAALNDRPASEPPAASVETPAPPRDRRVVALGIAAVVALAAVAYFVWRDEQVKPAAPEGVDAPPSAVAIDDGAPVPDGPDVEPPQPATHPDPSSAPPPAAPRNVQPKTTQPKVPPKPNGKSTQPSTPEPAPDQTEGKPPISGYD